MSPVTNHCTPSAKQKSALRGNAPRSRRVLILFQVRFGLRFEKKQPYLSPGALAFGPRNRETGRS
jgi:hypothetical protein